VDRLDNVNFSTSTLWEASLVDGGAYVVASHRAPGRQYIREATDLTGVPDRHYDFVMSSHTLEHVANPLRALHEWHRVLKPGGTLVVVLPNGAKTFDRMRPTTQFEHLVSDFERDVGEDDETHVEDARRLHDHSRDEAVIPPDVQERPNILTRALHHHVFDMPLLIRAVESAGYQLITSDWVQPYHLVVVAEVIERRNIDQPAREGIA
jgi:SAM-dependent methyltransferase